MGDALQRVLDGVGEVIHGEEHCLREDLNETAQRVMAVIRPVKLTITNYPEGQSETFEMTV